MQEFFFYPIFILFLIAFGKKFTLPAIFRKSADSGPDMLLFSKVNAILEKNIPYYLKLSNNGKKKFYTRLQEFIDSKRWVGMEGIVVTGEMKVTIAAPAIQLTFGLSSYSLETIEAIEVYPETFYSRFHPNKLKGITTGTGVLAVSWADVQEGFRIYDDKFNLGLHEMAHALKLTVVREYDFDPDFASYLEDWLKVGMSEYFLMKNDESSFMRTYGGSNTQEFFAVSVEHFFEASAEFRKTLPDIYNHLCVLLNQDPLNEKDDYRLKPGFAREVNFNGTLFPIPEKIRRNYKYSNWHWTLSLLVAGILWIMILPFGAVNTNISGDDVWRLMWSIALAGAITLFRPIVLNRVMNFFQFLGYTAVIIMPMGLSMFFMINKLFPVSVQKEEHRIISGREYRGELYYKFEGDTRNRKMSVEFGPEVPFDLSSGRYALVSYSKTGLFGYDVETKDIELYSGD